MIGWDSLNNYLLKKVDFPDSLVARSHAMIFSFRLDQDKKGTVKKVSFISSMPENSPSAQQIIPILQNEIVWQKLSGKNEITLIISRFNDPYSHSDYLRDSGQLNKFTAMDSNNTREATFPGGMIEFSNYIASNFNYPERCKKQKINGYILVDFVVETNGSIKKIDVMEESKKCPEFTTEALRVLKNCPRWIPGTGPGGVLVRSYRTLPFNLRVN